MSSRHCARVPPRERKPPSYCELLQDKRDSLRLCPAVGLSLRFNAFIQAAFSTHSLSLVASLCNDASISTSSALRHGA